MGVQNIARTERITSDGVFRGWHQQAQSDRKIFRHDQIGKPNRVGCTAHIFFHHAHGRTGFDIQAAAIESDAFPDNSDLGRILIAPSEVN